MSERHNGRRVAALFGDQAFGSVIIQKAKDSGYTNCFEVNFGAASGDPHYLNVRAMIWARLKEWLHLGAIPEDEKLIQQFLGPGFHHRQGNKLVLESKESMKKRKCPDPHFVDALACTFLRNVGRARSHEAERKRKEMKARGYAGMDRPGRDQEWMG